MVMCKPLVSIPIVTLGVAGERNTIFQIHIEVLHRKFTKIWEGAFNLSF